MGGGLGINGAGNPGRLDQDLLRLAQRARIHTQTRRHAWLVQYLSALRAGQITLAPLP